MLTAEDVRSSFKYLFRAELPALKSLVAQLPPNPLVINIGAGAGTSGLAILETRPDVVLMTIDITDASSPFGCLEAERDVINRAGYGSTWQKRWWQIYGDSKLTGKSWVNTSFYVEYFGAAFRMAAPNMVFIDGDHSYEGCKGDIEAWFPHLVPGGIMAVHDYLKGDLQPDLNGPHPMNWPGVDSAVNELLIPNFDMILHVDSLVAFRK